MKNYDLDIQPDWNSMAHYEPDFHGASIISADGSETPITEKMIQTAFDALMNNDSSGSGGVTTKNQHLTENNPSRKPLKPKRETESILA